MNLRKTIAAAFAAGAVLLSTVIPGYSQTVDSKTATITITGGSLTPYVEYYAFNDADFSFQAQDVLGGLELAVHDDRGTYNGWNVTGTMTPLQGTNPGTGAPITAQIVPSLDAYLNPVPGFGSAITNPTFTSVPNGLNLSVPVGQGSGHYTLDLDLTAKMPAGAAATSYSSTVTLTAIGAP